MIKKTSGGYKVVSEKTGKNLGGPYKTKAQAQKRLRQVEFFTKTDRSKFGLDIQQLASDTKRLLAPCYVAYAVHLSQIADRRSVLLSNVAIPQSPLGAAV